MKKIVEAKLEKEELTTEALQTANNFDATLSYDMKVEERGKGNNFEKLNNMSLYRGGMKVSNSKKKLTKQEREYNK